MLQGCARPFCSSPRSAPPPRRRRRLSRRTRALLLDAQAARESAPEVAALMAEELKKDKAWEDAQVKEFEALAKGYLPKL